MNLEMVKNATELKARHGERGAALITVLFVATLLMAAGGALVLITGMASRTAIDSTAEMQAYYSAEAGLQSTLNVLRGNTAPNAGMPAGTQISFRSAITPSESNLPGDTTGIPRLSGWLNYDYAGSGGNPDRVSLTAGYSPLVGLAYSVRVTDPDGTATGEPDRLLVRVTGYGPKGAVKQLDLVVKRTSVDYSPAAMLVMRGSDNGTPVQFDIGNSNAKDYSGHDHAGTGVLPTFGATSDSDRDLEIAADGKDTAAAPKAATLGNSALPPWLRSASEARAFVADQKSSAIQQGRYFTSFSGNSGGTGAPAFTFVDGDCDLDGGSGLLIVTGNLNMSGNPSFDGLILVLGSGTVNRNGGGNGAIYGALVVAGFPLTGNGGFTAPAFNTNGGGNSTMQYDSAAVRQALNLAGPRVMAVGEY